MKDYDVVLKLHKLISGKVRKSASTRKDKPNWSQYYILRVCNRKSVEPTLKAILPWLSKRRATKVKELLASYE